MAGHSTKGTDFLSIRGKRRSMSVGRLKQRFLEKPDAYQGHRALVRVGEGTTNILIGKEDLSKWDDEELRRGRKRRRDGTFAGRDPVVVAKAVHDEMVKRTLDEANKLLQENLQRGLEILVEIMTDERVDAKDRLKAIEMITNRAMGKEPQKLEVKSEGKWQMALADSIVSMPAALVDPEIDNRDEDVDDEEDEDDDDEG